MTRLAIETTVPLGRFVEDAQALTAGDPVLNHMVEGGCDSYEVEVLNGDDVDSATVTAQRIACPLCGATGEPTCTPLAAPSAPVATLDLASGNVTAGDHSLKVTYTTADGESLPSPKSNVVTADGTHQKITTTLPISAHESVTGRKVYMSEAGDAGPWKLVDTVADNTTATYQINLADASLTDAVPTADDALPEPTGAVTVAAGDMGRIGPLPTNLYGQGAGGTDLYLDITGDGAASANLVSNPCAAYTAPQYDPYTGRDKGGETEIAKVATPGRSGDNDEAPTALDAVNGMVCLGAADTHYFQVCNTDLTDPLTVTAERVRCTVCGYGADPSGKGSVTVAAGDVGYLGPLEASLYGQGSNLTDIYLTSTESTGTIVALPV